MSLNKLFSLLFFLLTACQNSTPGKNLIIFFDRQYIDSQTLIQKGNPWNVSLLYDYKNFNGIAVHIPNGNDIETVKQFYEQQEAVLGVNEEKIMELHQPQTLSK